MQQHSSIKIQIEPVNHAKVIVILVLIQLLVLYVLIPFSMIMEEHVFQTVELDGLIKPQIELVKHAPLIVIPVQTQQPVLNVIKPLI